MLVKHKIEYIEKGEKHSLLNILHSNKDEVVNDIIKNEDILDATIQEYPLYNNDKRKIKSSGEVVYSQRERKHIVSFSGGKDSTAMLIRMLELGMKVDKIVFADTKYEFQEMYDYVDKIEAYIQDRFDSELYIKRLRTEEELYNWIFGRITRGKRKGEVRGFPLIMFPCNWSRKSKVEPLNQVMQGHHRYIGITFDEKNRMFKDTKNALLYYPLIEWEWTGQDCMDYLRDLDLVNPLYTDEITRTGCWWCPKQSIGAWRSLYLNHPDKWSKLKEAEKKLGKPITDKVSMVDMEERFKQEKMDGSQ